MLAYPLKHISTWKFIREHIGHGDRVGLLYVLESNGSSPGRKGFAMAATETECTGSIGGGIMEFKLVELCRQMITTNNREAKLITQYHDKEHVTDQSGMICSGMQRVVIKVLDRRHLELIDSCLATGQEQKQLIITPVQIELQEVLTEREGFVFENENNWRYAETLGEEPRIHIIGAGHISQALSELMSRLGFYVLVYDDRSELNTFINNQSAHEKHVIDFDTIGEHITNDVRAYVVIMTIGYRLDKKVLKQLIQKEFRYLGMLGSKAKIQTLFAELLEEGYTQEQLSKVQAPIGIPIHSKTAYEIAVSVAAEIIKAKNAKNETTDN